MKKFLVCALEPSANLHLKEILSTYKAEFGDFDLCGIYDEKLCKEFKLHSKPLYSSHEFSAMGFVEVLPLILKAKRAIKELTTLVLESENLHLNLDKNSHSNSKENLEKNSSNLNENSQENLSQNDTNFLEKNVKNFEKNLDENLNSKPSLEEKNSQNLNQNSQKNSYTNSSEISAILCIDSPAFNLPFAKALKKAGSKTKRIYYILPQVWAWKKGRIPIIESHFDILASILPFDSQFFSKSKFVGHPLLDEIKENKDESEQKAILSKQENEKIIAFLPGSRRSEIKRLMPLFKDLAKEFQGEKVLCVPSFNLDKITEIYGDISEFKVQSNAPKVLKKADFAFICSGTATLEAALVGTPFVLAYKAKAIDFFIAKIFVKLKHIGLANIFCDFANKTPLHPEFIQDEVSVQNLYQAYLKFDYKEFFAKVSFLKEYLQNGSAKNMVKILNEI